MKVNTERIGMSMWRRTQTGQEGRSRGEHRQGRKDGAEVDTGPRVWHGGEDGQAGRGKKQRLYLIDERLSGGERKLSLHSTG